MKRALALLAALALVMIAGAPAHAYNGVWALGHVQNRGWEDPSPTESFGSCPVFGCPNHTNQPNGSER